MAESAAEIEATIAAHLQRSDYRAAAAEARRGYGPSLFGYLIGVVRDVESASEAYSHCCEKLWRSMEQYRGDASFRTWAYHLAWVAARDQKRDAFRRRASPLEET